MLGDFKSYSSVQQPQISPSAKVRLHIAEVGGQFHHLRGIQRKCDGAGAHQVHWGKVDCCFLEQYEVFKTTVKWMLAPAGHRVCLLSQAFSSRNQVLENPFELTRLDAPLQTHFSDLLWVLSHQRFSLASFTSPLVLDFHTSSSPNTTC